MPRVLLATDADWIHQEVDAALGGDDIEVVRVSQGTEVRPVVQAGNIDLVVLDLQIGNMGGMAACMDLRLDESVDLLPHIPVLMLLDRDVDAFLAKRSEADGWVIKPLDPFSLRRAATALLAGGEWKPEPTDTVEEPEEIEGDDAEFEGTSEETRLDDAEITAPSVDEVTAEGDESADPTTEPGAEKSAESAADVQGP